MRLLLAASLLTVATTAQAQTTLGGFTFDNSKFGNSATISDAAFFDDNWLNTTNANPGLLSLTGVNFNTGVANLGVRGTPIIVGIGYSGGIANGTGADFGVVTARFSADNYRVRVSTDGITFGDWLNVLGSSAFATGEIRQYNYAGVGLASAEFYVHALDLSAFDIGAGESVLAIEVEGSTELDLIRVAGFVDGTPSSVVPEPGTWMLMAGGLAGLGVFARRRRA